MPSDLVELDTQAKLDCSHDTEDHDPMRSCRIGEASNPGSTPFRIKKEDIVWKTAAIVSDLFRPAKAYEGCNEGYVYKRGSFGDGYYKDSSNGGTITLPLQGLIYNSHQNYPKYDPCATWALCIEDKADSFHVPSACLGDGRHFTKRRCAKHKAAAYISVNGNCSGTTEALIKTVPPPAEVLLIGVQEIKVSQDGINDATGRYRKLGWEASIVPCVGKGVTASCGVGLLVRPGISATPIKSSIVGFHVPTSPRFGFWFVEGGHLG